MKKTVLLVALMLFICATISAQEKQYIMLSYDVEILSSGEFIKFIKMRNIEDDTERVVSAKSITPDILLAADEGDMLLFDGNDSLIRIMPRYEMPMTARPKKNVEIIRVKIVPHFVQIKTDGSIVGQYVVDNMHKIVLLETGEVAIVNSKDMDREQWCLIEEEAIVKIERIIKDNYQKVVIKKVK